MALFIRNDATARLVAELATQRGVTRQAAVHMAVQAALTQDVRAVPLADRLARLWREHPLPPRTGDVADKEFFLDLSERT